ncbi:MAG: D-alanyl-D-alanine carboxypeptidase [Gammaproteobacteria bacterium]|nr:D-alanyl-D-alanine carboxypeptidase [Gammaproteobacteria bacterium]
MPAKTFLNHHTSVVSLLSSILLIALLSVSFSLLAAPRPIPAAPAVAASGYILQDFHTGKIIASSKADERLEPASLTKLMSAYIVFTELEKNNIGLADEVLISETAWRTGGSRMFVEAGSKVSVENLIKGMIIQSGNDATVALAEYVAGTEGAFAELMNHEAKLLGMTSSNFQNASGLPGKEHYTTATDLAILTRALIANFPAYYPWYSQKEFTYNDITQPNRNKLLWRDDTVDGVKTGHTSSAGYCLVTSALRDGMRLISVVLGTKSPDARARESQKLLNYGYRFFETRRLYVAGESLSTSKLWKGNRDQISVGVNEDIYVTIPRGQDDALSATIQIQEQIIAPIEKNSKLGIATVTFGEEVLVEQAVIALDEYSEGGLIQRLKDTVLLFFE